MLSLSLSLLVSPFPLFFLPVASSVISFALSFASSSLGSQTQAPFDERARHARTPTRTRRAASPPSQSSGLFEFPFSLCYNTACWQSVNDPLNGAPPLSILFGYINTHRSQITVVGADK